MDIKLISTENLRKDLHESITDIRICKMALRMGVTTYSGGSVASRLAINEKIVDTITAELKIRGEEQK